MAYAKDNSIEEFNIWHDKVNKAKGYPNDKGTTKHTEAKTKEGEKTVYSNTYGRVDEEGKESKEGKMHPFWDGMEELFPKKIITNEEFNALNWLPTEDII